MSSYIIEGGKRLEGEIYVSGSKNAALPIMAATILNKGISKLYNIPDISDIKIMIEILRRIGCNIKRNGDRVIIDSSNVHKFEIPEDLMIKMRSSVIIAGALLGTYKEALFSYPGGCEIGARPIDLHLKGFKKLGINISEEYGIIKCIAKDIKGVEIDLDFPSVGATENIILASVLAKGTTIIMNAAMEPEIEDLQNFLNIMGAKIEGAGTSIIRIEGVSQLKDVSYTVMPDRIEAGTFLCAGAITGGKIEVKKAEPKHIRPVIEKLREQGCGIRVEKNIIKLESKKRLKAIDIKTMPYPGFPTDMQSIFVPLLCVSTGTSVVEENIFENKYKYIQELKKMGAKVKTEGRTAIIKGTKKIYGTKVKATDLRGGASVVLAGLIAKGITQVDNIKYILRGYENFDEKLKSLGANINILI